MFIIILLQLKNIIQLNLEILRISYYYELYISTGNEFFDLF